MVLHSPLPLGEGLRVTGGETHSNIDFRIAPFKTLQVTGGETHSNIDFRIAPFKKGTWKTYTSLDGLTSK